jgi:putative adenylate-forming enzyme
MADFEAFNRVGLTTEEGWKALASGGIWEGYHVGASTGTSGNRGLYVISESERHAWLGAILAKALPGIWKPWAPRERVAIILPFHARLYDAASGTGRIRLRFFDLTLGPQAWREELAAFAPTTIVAPPKILRWLAESTLDLAPTRLFSGAEVLDPNDRRLIEEHFGKRLGQIYMATEGLIAVTCPEGTLHLCEDILHVELDPVPGSDLVSPIITDFRRRTQVMLRYRMNDLLRLARTPCSCGSPCVALAEVVGRQDDVFRFSHARQEILVTPDVMRNAILDADRRIQDFRLTQIGGARVALTVPSDLPDEAARRAREALLAVFRTYGLVRISVDLENRLLSLPVDRKLRRVRRDVDAIAASEAAP